MVLIKPHYNLIKLTATEEVHIESEEVVDNFEEYLLVLLEDNNAHILDDLDVSTKELAEKSYTRKKPFKASGEGHKDYLI